MPWLHRWPSFLLLTFLVPIFMLLGRSVDNPEVVTNLPATSKLIASWDRRALPSEDVFQAMARDLTAAKEAKTVSEVAKRLNMDISGFRSLIQKTARKMPLELAAGESMRDRFIQIDERWGDPDHWHVIAKNAKSWTPYYLYSSLDLRETKARYAGTGTRRKSVPSSASSAVRCGSAFG